MSTSNIPDPDGREARAKMVEGALKSLGLEQHKKAEAEILNQKLQAMAHRVKMEVNPLLQVTVNSGRLFKDRDKIQQAVFKAWVAQLSSLSHDDLLFVSCVLHTNNMMESIM